MTSISIKAFADQILKDSNLDHNDYAYYSGWSPDMKLGQQYEMGEAEARELKREIQTDGWFTDPMLPGSEPMDLRRPILETLHKISTPEAARQMPKGSIRVTKGASAILNSYAKELGSEVRFEAHSERPNHPVG